MVFKMLKLTFYTLSDAVVRKVNISCLKSKSSCHVAMRIKEETSGYIVSILWVQKGVVNKYWLTFILMPNASHGPLSISVFVLPLEAGTTQLVNAFF